MDLCDLNIAFTEIFIEFAKRQGENVRWSGSVTWLMTGIVSEGGGSMFIILITGLPGPDHII